MTTCNLMRNCKGEVFISINNELIEVVPAGFLGIGKTKLIESICPNNCKGHEGLY